MRHQVRLAIVAGAVAGLSITSPPVGAVPTVSQPQVYTDNVGPNPYILSGWLFGVGAISVTPSGVGTSVKAVHVNPSDPSQNYAVPATMFPIYPNSYFAVMPYTGQSGQWQIRATDSNGTGVATTHVLDDIRQLPIVPGLVASGSLLTPTVSWSRMDRALYPSTCIAPCSVGFDFFNYAVIVRDTAGSLLYQTSAIANDPLVPTQWTLPSGVLADGHDYLIGVRLNMSELESTNPFTATLENRSTAYLPYSTVPVPEPATTALWLAGLTAVAAQLRHRGCATGSSRPQATA